MIVNTDSKQVLSLDKKKGFWRIWGYVAVMALLAFFCAAVTAIITLLGTYIWDKGVDAKTLSSVTFFLKKVFIHPKYLFETYAQWWHFFLASFSGHGFRISLFLPLLAPVSGLAVLFVAFFRSVGEFSLWYVFHCRFAKVEDIKKMSLTEGFMLVLGQFCDRLLNVGRAASVLCFGEAGSGKTSSVAIPSILHSDNASVLAVDNSGTLARYTSGYRAQIGKVFYFNWDLLDEVSKGHYFPRWNPIDEGNLPFKEPERTRYLNFLSGFLITQDEQDVQDDYWHLLTTEALATFIRFVISKISQAKANDYFLGKILEKGHLNRDDKDVLLSYYLTMPLSYSQQAVDDIKEDKFVAGNYLPVGSWAGIPSAWQGKDVCLSMVSDWLLKNYLSEKDDGGGWRGWINSLLIEAQLFNYDSEVVEGLRKLVYLPVKQQEIIFPLLVKPLMIFRNVQVRERTCGSDFRLSMLRGIKDPQTKERLPVTVYSTANTKSTKFIGRLFMEMALRSGLNETYGKIHVPLLVVMDDVGQMLKVQTLKEAVVRGAYKKISFLLLCNSLHNMESLYGRDALEELIANTNYKIILAQDNKMMSRQLDKLAVYATRSVQIPADKKRKGRKSFSDANYYHKLSKDLLVRKNLSVETKGYQLLLVEGYYHRPILAENVCFLHDERFKEKALLDTAYQLDDELLQKRNNQDLLVPDAEELIFGDDVGLDDETELNQFMDIVYDEAVKTAEEEVSKTNKEERKEVLSEEAGNDTEKNTEESTGDWWMTEQAFNTEDKEKAQNPFAKK